MNNNDAPVDPNVKVPKEIQEPRDDTPRWLRQSQKGWIQLWKDLNRIYQKAEKTGPIEVKMSYFDFWKIIVVTLAGTACVISVIKLLQWLWSLSF